MRARPRAGNAAARRALLACGIGYPVAYVVANDVVAAAIYGDYSRRDQAISELSATRAPSKSFLAAMLPLFSLLLTGFGLGVRRSARTSTGLRVTGSLLVVQGPVAWIWLWFPMSSREEMVRDGAGANDTGHLVLSGLAALFILGEMGSSAAGLDGRFRAFAAATAATGVTCGYLTGVKSSDITSGAATPGLGVVERIMYGSWLLWMAVLAVVLLRRR